jgi:hypothetical protein
VMPSDRPAEVMPHPCYDLPRVRQERESTESRSPARLSHKHEPDPAYLAPNRLLDHPLRDGDVAFLRESLIPAVGAAAILGLGQLGLA